MHDYGRGSYLIVRALQHYHLQLMGIEIDSKFGGAGSTFFASIVAIEELAKVDPSVSVVCDVQNTLVNEYFRRYASLELQEKYFPRLAKDLVGCYEK